MYYLLVLLILFLHFRLSKQPLELRAKKENTYVFIICVVLILMAAFRSDAVGADTPGYRWDFENMGSFHSFQELVDRFTPYYMGYFALCKLFHMVGLPIYVWFGCIEAFYLFALIKLVNKISKDKIFSLLIFTTIGLFSFSMAGLKQTLAMSFMMLAFISLTEKKYWITVLLFVLTYYTHQSALIMFGAFPLYFFRKNKLLIPVAVLIFVLLYIYGFFFLGKIVDVIGNEKWEGYLVEEKGYTSTTLVFYTVITLIASFNAKNYIAADPLHAKLIISLSIIGCGFQILASTSPNMFRLALCYTPFLMIMLPNATYYSRNKQLVRLFLMVSIIFYFLYTNRNWPYSFVKLF